MAAGAFYFDLASPRAYLAAERALHLLPFAAEWTPVLARELPAADAFEGFRCAEEEAIFRLAIERAARAQELQPLRWPDPFPFDSELAMRAATYAAGIGKGVAFAQAAFRQAFAGGRTLAEEDNVLIAAAACEIHPVALRRALSARSTVAALAERTLAAGAVGVEDVPAVRWGERVFVGALALEQAAAAAQGQ